MKNLVIQEVEFHDGENVITEGDWPYYAYVVQSGRARVMRLLGDKEIAVAQLTEGDIFGEVSLIGKTKHSASVVADGDLKVGIIARETFVEALDQLGEPARERLLQLSQDMALLNDVYTRLSQCLDELGDLRDRASDRDAIQDELEKLPEVPRKVAQLISDRFHSAVESCARLMQRLERLEQEVTVTR